MITTVLVGLTDDLRIRYYLQPDGSFSLSQTEEDGDEIYQREKDNELKVENIIE